MASSPPDDESERRGEALADGDAGKPVGLARQISGWILTLTGILSIVYGLTYMVEAMYGANFCGTPTGPDSSAQGVIYLGMGIFIAWIGRTLLRPR